MEISFVVPGRNNLKYFKWSYDSIRKNQGDHKVKICFADDYSNDGTREWCKKKAEEDEDFSYIINPGPKRLGHTILYDKIVEDLVETDMAMIWHCDMYLCPGALDAIEKHMYNVDTFSREELEQDKLEKYERETGEKIDKLDVKVKKPKTIVSLTRIEPPLHPDGPEKILKDYGIEPEEFKEDELLEYVEKGIYRTIRDKGNPEHKQTEGIFAPWAFWVKDFKEIGGHDPIFAPQSKEDTDIFNRFHLNGIKFVQTWEGFVYHMTCRGSRFADGAERNPNGEVFMKNRETDEWLKQNQKSTKEFIRKWGHFCKHDELMKPIVPPKYNIGIRIENCDPQLLAALEPWCNRIYVDNYEFNLDTYLRQEQHNTSFNIKERVHNLTAHDKYDYDDVVIEIDGKVFGNEEYNYIQNISEILYDSGEVGEFGLGNLKITINQMDEYQNDLIKL